MFKSLKKVTKDFLDIFRCCDSYNHDLVDFCNERIGFSFKIPRNSSIKRNKDKPGRCYEVITESGDEYSIGIYECLEETPVLQKMVKDEVELIGGNESYHSFVTTNRCYHEYTSSGYNEYKEELSYFVFDQRFSHSLYARTMPSFPQTVFIFQQVFSNPCNSQDEVRNIREKKEVGNVIYESFELDLPDKVKGSVTFVNEKMKINFPHPCFRTTKKTDGYICHLDDKFIEVSEVKKKSSKKYNIENEETEGENEKITESKKKEEEEEDGEESEDEEEKEKNIEIREQSQEEEEKEEEIKNIGDDGERLRNEIEELTAIKTKIVLIEEFNKLVLKYGKTDILQVETHGFEAKKFESNIKLLDKEESSKRIGKAPFCIYRYNGEHVGIKLTFPYYMFVMKEFFTRDNDPLVVINSNRQMMTKISVKHFENQLALPTKANGNNSPEGGDSEDDAFYLQNIFVEHKMFDRAERIHNFPHLEKLRKLGRAYRYQAVIDKCSNMVTFLVLKDNMTVIRIHSMFEDGGLFVPKVFNIFRMIHSMVDCRLNDE